MPDRLESRKKAAEEINRVFGWSVTVEYGETVKKENKVIDSNVEQEIAEVKNVSRETDADNSETDGETDGENDDRP